MARDVRPECGGASCAIRAGAAELNVYRSGKGAAAGSSRATSGTTDLRHPQPYGVMCRDCAPVGCDGSCDLPPFTD